MIEPSELSTGATASQRNSPVNRADQIHRMKLMARRFWWIAALTIMIGLGIQDYLCLHQVTHYSSSARMIMSGRLSLPEGDVYNDTADNFFGTQAALMKSQATLNLAVERVNTIHPEIVADEAALVEVGVEPRTSIFNLKVTSNNADYAKLLLDAVMDTYLLNKRGRKNQTTDEAVSAITEEISRLDAEIRNDEQELLDFQKQNNVVFIEEQSSSSAAYLVGLNDELARLIKERDLSSLESKDPLLGANYDRNADSTGSSPGSTPPASPGLTPPASPGSTAPANPGSTAPTSPASTAPASPGSPPSMVPGSTTTDNRAAEADPILIQQDRIEKLKISRDQFGVYLKDKHPKMIELADQIDQEQKFLDVLTKRSSTRRDQFGEDLELKIKNLQQQIQVSNANSLKLSESLASYQQLKNKINREQGLYNQLALSIQNVDFNKSLDQEDVVILEAASKAKPITAENILHLAFGFAGGLIAGVAIIYFVHRLDDKIYSTSQLEENFDLPIMGLIPHVQADKLTKRVALLEESDHRHEFLEYHRNLRSAILFHSTEATKLGSLMICSAAPGEGKSTLSADLAIVFAHSGLRVLLIDADLRRGALHALFDVPENPGLSNYLRGEISWHEVVHETKVANLSLMPRGKVLDRTGDLLLGGATDVLLQESTPVFDIVLWDSAPLLAANDAANLCSKVDGILFVARARYSTLSAVRSALEDLSQRNAKILGFVLNAVEYQRPGYLSKYRYKEYYEATDRS